MNITKNFNKTAIAIGLLASLHQQATHAEGIKVLEVIEVTAQKRVQNVKEVPISMTAVNQEKLLESNISTTEELSSYIANFSVGQSGQGYNVIMRGLGSGPNQGFEQTVGTFVDGIYRGRGHLMRSAFLDLERVEVLRGPQSALFGKNTTAGALNLTNAKPTEDLEAYINLNYNFDFSQTTLETAVSNSLSDTVQARVALKVVDGDGPYTNIVTGNDEVGHETLIGRLSLAWQPTSDINVLFTAQHDADETVGADSSQSHVEPAAYEALKAHPLWGQITDVTLDDYTQKTNPGVGEIEQADYVAEHYTLNVEYDMGDLLFTSITGIQEYDLKGSTDGDHTIITNVHRVRGDEKFSQISQEFRLTSALDGDFNYIAGLYYQTTDLDYDENYRVYPLAIDGVREFDVDSTTQAVFAQLDYKFAEQWEATLGLRYSTEDKDGMRSLTSLYLPTGNPIVDEPLVKAPAIAKPYPDGLPGNIYSAVVLKGMFNIEDHLLNESRTDSAFTPSLNIKYKMEDAMIYALVSTGTKASGFDSRANNADDFDFEDESVVSYELGTKLTLDDGLADLNIAIFNMIFEDLQTSVFDGGTGFFVENGGKATSRGIEIDGRWAFADSWLFSGSLGLLDFTWDEFTTAKCYRDWGNTIDSSLVVPDTGGKVCDYSGKTNAFAPKVSGSANLEYYTELGESFELKANLELTHKSSYYTNGDLNPFNKQDATTKVNARISLLDINGTWQVALLGKNLTDERTISFSTDMTLGPQGYYAAWMDPGRSISLQFGYSFE